MNRQPYWRTKPTREESTTMRTPNYEDQIGPMTSAPEPDMKLGTVVIFMDEGHNHNGATEHPAIVTRVWGPGPRPTVNLTVLPDCAEPFFASSCTHWKSTTRFPEGGKFNYRYREA